MEKGLLDMKPLYNREVAIDAIGEAIIEAMKEGDGRTRCYGAKALGTLKAKKALHPLMMEYLNDEDPDVRCDAAASLGEIGDREAIPALIQSLKDGDGLVRVSAIGALAKIGDPIAVEPLIHAMVSPGSFPYMLGVLSGDTRWEIRERAAEALGHIRDPRSVQGLMDILHDEDVDLMLETVFQSLVQSGDRRGLDAVATYLKDTDTSVRRKAARAFIYAKDREVLDRLIETLIDEDSVVKVNIIEAVGNISGEREILPLLFLLKDEDEDVRGKAAETICKIDRGRSMRFISPLLQDPSANVRRKAIELLAEIGSGECAEVLIPSLEDKDTGVCGEAVLALGKIGDDRAVPPLLSILKNRQKRTDLRWAAIFALGKTGFLDGLDVMIDLLLDQKEDEALRRMVLQVLPTFGSMFGQDAFLQRMNVLLNNGDVLVKKGLAKILRGFRDPESESLLLCLLLHDESDEVKREAAISLAYRGKDVGIDILTSLITPFLSTSEGGDPCIEEVCDALKEIVNDRAVNLLLKGVTSKNSSCRCFAVRAIGHRENRGFVEPIADLLTDEDKDVRREAVIALGRQGDRRALSLLIQSLYDYERFNDLRREIISALKKIDVEESTEILLETLLDKEKKDNHWAAIEALSTLYSVAQRTIPEN